MLSLAADDSEQGRAMGNNQSIQVGAEARSGMVGGALAATLIKLPLLVFAGAAIVGGLLVGGLRRKEVMGAYLLSLASLMAASGRQADLYGRRRLFLIGRSAVRRRFDRVRGRAE
jgi:hypothetical protein